MSSFTLQYSTISVPFISECIDIGLEFISIFTFIYFYAMTIMTPKNMKNRINYYKYQTLRLILVVFCMQHILLALNHIYILPDYIRIPFEIATIPIETLFALTVSIILSMIISLYYKIFKYISQPKQYKFILIIFTIFWIIDTIISILQVIFYDINNIFIHFRTYYAIPLIFSFSIIAIIIIIFARRMISLLKNLNNLGLYQELNGKQAQNKNEYKYSAQFCILLLLYIFIKIGQLIFILMKGWNVLHYKIYVIVNLCSYIIHRATFISYLRVRYNKDPINNTSMSMDRLASDI